MNTLKNAFTNLNPGDLIYVFIKPIQDRHDIEVYLVKKWQSNVLMLQKPNGTIIKMTESDAPNNDVLIISNSGIVGFDYATHEWVFKNAG